VETADFLDLFISEAREHIEGQGALLARARTSSLAREEINDLFRHAHSIKGMAAAMGFSPMSALAHAMEDLLHLWRDQALTPTPEALDLLTRASDRLSAQVDAAEAQADLPGGGEIERQIRSLCPSPGDAPRAALPPGAGGGEGSREAPAPGGGEPPGSPGEDAGEPVPAPDRARPRLLVDIAIRPGAPLPGARAMVILKRLEGHGRVLEIAPSPQVLATGNFNGRLRVVLASNVAADRLAAIGGGLPDVAACHVTPAAPRDEADVEDGRRLAQRRSLPDRREGEGPGSAEGRAAGTAETAVEGAGRAEAISTIRVATERMDHLLDGIGELILDRERLKRALDPAPGSPEAEILEGLGRTVDALRDEVMTMRLLPFSSIVPRLERAVRELAARLGKDVELEVRGTDVSLDRSTLEEMIDPLQHILRNSIDHALEPAEERRAAGKPARGRIEIELARRDERVCLAVSDDGRGMDPQSLRRVAVERRFLSREAAMRLSDEEALMLVTIPGFSTAARTTDISGRGVGMDVVRMRVQKLGGHLIIRSQVGVGTRLEMDLPPTVTVTRAFLCRAGGGIFAVPVSAVRATFEVHRDSMQASQGERVLRRGDDLVTVLPLGGILSGDRAAQFPDAFPALVYQVGHRTYALGVDEILGEEPIVVKPLRHPLELLPQYAGAAILNDGQIALIVDPVNLTRTSRQT
jgi:two-component system chemotaxis sensor kinase CheA